MCAVRNGQSIDTSMGFAPGCGLMMGARAGDVEPALVLEIMSRHALTVELMQAYLQSQSGFQGLVGESDFRHLLDRYQQEDASVQAAFQQCVYRFQKTLGSYVVALGGLDAVILTGTAVERNPFLRSLLLEGLQCLGVTINHERNDETIATDGVISDDGALVRVSVMRTHEALEIANVVKTFVY
jgi:acetate kinase